MKIFGIELKFNGFDIFHKGNFDPNSKANKDGETMTAKLTLPAGIASEASLNIPHGVAPSSPVNGDVWTTTSAFSFRLNGVTRTMAHTGSWSTVSLAEAEAGTATTQRLWTAQRVAQAISALQAIKSVNGQTGDINIVIPTKLSQFENDIGAGGGVKITTAATAPSSPSPGDFWYKEL